MGEIIVLSTRLNIQGQSSGVSRIVAGAFYALSKFDAAAARTAEDVLRYELAHTPLKVYRTLAEILLLDSVYGMGSQITFEQTNLLKAVHLAVTQVHISRSDRIELQQQIVTLRRRKTAECSHLDALYYAIDVSVTSGDNAGKSAYFFVKNCIEFQKWITSNSYTQAICKQLIEKMQQ